MRWRERTNTENVLQLGHLGEKKKKKKKMVNIGDYAR